jgi:SAM-dependent methyltransferase
MVPVVPASPLWNPWANDRRLLDLYRRRCRQEVDEMTCAGQAAEILKEMVRPGETLLDAGCGGGYYHHAFEKRAVPVLYHGLDYTPEMVELARTELCPRVGLPSSRFQLGAIEWLDEQFDNILCFNVLTNSAHYALPLERLLRCARRRLLIRESMGTELVVRYTPDPNLDEGKRHIRVYHNTYPLEEVMAFMDEFGFEVRPIRDLRSQDGTETVVGIPHTWRILLGERRG